MVGVTEAQLRYEFLEDVPERTVVATIEFAELPSLHEGVVGLSFTTRGEELFGFGEVYLGDFDQMTPGTNDFVKYSFWDAGRPIDGLAGTGEDLIAAMDDLNPPASSIEGFATTERFWLGASFVVNPPSDFLILDYVDPAGEMERLWVSGFWSAVPEPSFGLLHLVIASLISLTCRRRRA